MQHSGNQCRQLFALKYQLIDIIERSCPGKGNRERIGIEAVRSNTRRPPDM